MKKFIIIPAVAAAIPLVGAAATKVAPTNSASKENEKPNIIFILGDDLGMGDIGAFGQRDIKTPNIDRLVREGMVFTRAYCGDAVSSPSRCVLMTGQHTGHSAIRGNLRNATIRPEDITIPEAIKKNTDYVTGMTGRWHLGEEGSNQTPYDRGFDYVWGKLGNSFKSTMGVFVDGLWDKDGKHVPPEVYTTHGQEAVYENGKYYNLTPEEMAHRPINLDRMLTDKAKVYIEKNRNKNFFLYMAYCLPHAPMQYQDQTPVSPNSWPDTERAFASMVQCLDKYVGEITDKVDQLGIGKKTMIIFTSDNGAHNEGGHSFHFFRSTGDFRGFKRDFYDGGFHTPFIVRWPGTVKAGSKSDHLMAFQDVMPTVCELAGAPIPAGIDGISFAPTLKGKPAEQKQHEYLYWEFNEHSDMSIKTPEYKQAVVFGNWKLIKYVDDNRTELYYLPDDVGETNDLAAKHPDLVAKGLKLMERAHVYNSNFPLLPSERPNGKTANQ